MSGPPAHRDPAGRVVVVTGGSRGIGAATAAAFAAAGARVVVAARPSDDLAQLARATGALAVPTDVRDAAQVAALAEEVQRRYGRLDVLVCAAGVGSFAAVESLALDAWDDMMAVNLRGTFLSCRAMLPMLLRQETGHIFTLASIAVSRAFAGAAAYTASKWGVLGFSRVLSEEVRRRGIRVTAVIPGSVDSPFWDAAGGTDLPRQAMLRPEDVARTMLMVADQPASVYTDEITVMPRDGIL